MAAFPEMLRTDRERRGFTVGHTAWSVHLIAFVWVVLVGVTACGGEAGDADMLFTTGQLAELVAQPEQAPPGTQYDEAQSGPASVDLLAQGVVTARSRFEELGYQGGWSSVFASTDPPPPAGALIGSGAFVFEDPAAASLALEVHRFLVIPDVLQGYEQSSAEDLGDEGYAFTFESGPAGAAGAIYVFRIRNAVFLVPGSGASLESEALLDLARSVASNARIESACARDPGCAGGKVISDQRSGSDLLRVLTSPDKAGPT